MKRSLLASLSLLLLSACAQNPDTITNPPSPPGGLELTSLATEGGVQRLTFFNVATMNAPGVRETLAITGTPAEALRGIDYAPDGTLYALGVLLPGDEATQNAIYTLDPLSGAATEVVRFELPFEPDDMRFMPGTDGRKVRVTERSRNLALPRSVLVNVLTGAVGAPLETDAGQALGTRPAFTAFDYSETELLAITGTGVDGYVQHLARAGIGGEATLTTVARVLTNLPYITSFVEDGPVGYATLAEFNRPAGMPLFISFNLNPSSPIVGESTRIATFPVSQLSLAKTPEDVVAARRAR